MKRNLVIIIGVVIVVLAVAGLFGWQRMTASAAAAIRLQTVQVVRGSIVATVNAAGNISAPQEAALGFETSGRVAQVNVQVGDPVKAGQLLMQLDTTDLNLALQSAQASLASAQASFDSAKIKDSQNANQLVVAKAALDKATVALQQAQANYDAVAWRSDIGMTSQAAALQSATSDYQSALATYNITVSSINDTALRTAQASLDQAQVAVQEAQGNLDKAKLVAPFDGYVSTVNYSVGDAAGSSTAVVLTNLSNLQVNVSVAEVDVAKLQVGQTAQLTLDALPNNTYNAKVISIGPVGTVTQGVVNYPVTVAITDADPGVKPGMTANLAIEVDHRDNVLVIPTRAVRTQGNQKTATVLYKGQTLTVPVTTGLSNDTMIQVTSGLQQGDVLVLNQTTTGQTRVGGFGGGGFFLGGR